MEKKLKYDKVAEPLKAEKAQMWKTAMGLQEVDGIHTSEYLVDVARMHVEGEISIDEAGQCISEYYKAKTAHDGQAERVQEADVVSQRITKILSEGGFSFTPAFYCGIHRKLFAGLFKNAGEIRPYNISKKEWVLSGESVIYGNAPDISATLEYDFGVERAFKYKGLDKRSIISHISQFVAYLWQIHPFGEGNTRTTAVFTILYLRSLGFTADNDIFEKNSWYFRNALVRANYNNLRLGITADMSYLEAFFENLMYNGTNVLSNRDMHDYRQVEKTTMLHDGYDIVQDYVVENPGQSAVAISRALGVPLRTVQRRIEQSEMIVHMGSKKTGGYYLK